MVFVEIALKNETGEIQLTIQFNQVMQMDKNIFYFIIYHYLSTCFGVRFCDHQHGVTQGYKRYNTYVHKMCNPKHIMFTFNIFITPCGQETWTMLLVKTDRLKFGRVYVSSPCVAFPMCIAANCSWSFVYCVIILCAFLLPHVYCFYYVCVLLSYIL